ncbi:MAG: TonB-dependent receptor [Alphaproteobacteria bacterium]|nr:TonB-dependent receptor [Alphaproteobacteria bacterium]
MRITKALLAGACPITMLAALSPTLAQSTGTQQVETVVVTGTRVSSIGLMNTAPIAKEQSTITSDFLETQTAGQTVFQSLNFMPGVNFTNNDPYGSSGGTVRLHGQDGAHISLTLDGMPLNDTGNYAIYTNQMPDSEAVSRVSVNQGTTDVDSPTAAAMGGVIAIQTDVPHDDFGALASASFGSFSKQRYLARIDTGTFGPWGTKAFAMMSYQDYDKFKGPGHLRKIQGNFNIYQDMGDLGWFSIAGHWNSNRNNSYYGLQWSPNTTGFTSSLTGKTDIIDGPGGYVANPLSTNSLTGTGWSRDYNPTCTYVAPTAGSADNTMTSCTNWYRGKINPSDTGNLRFHSLWHLLPNLTFTADASLQYVLANGGGIYTFRETSGQLGGGIGGAGTTTTPYGCIANVGCDLNGDGDVLDTVALYQPSTTNTRRWGYSSSLIYVFDENNTLQIAYTLDYGLHRQTGLTSYLNPVSGPTDPFGGLTDAAHRVYDANGVPLRYRDRKSKAILNQASFDYEGKYFDDMLEASLGFRLPFFERDLNQYCYEQKDSSNAYCTTQAPSAPNAQDLVTFAGSSTKYVAPGHTTVRYNKFLPHLGFTFLPFGKQHQFFVSYAQEMAAPKTDNLYKSGINAGDTVYTPFLHTKPETSTTYMLGYRYFGDDLQASAVFWNTQIHNRIVSSYDQDAKQYFDHTIGGANTDGVDVEASYSVTQALTLYGNASYDHSRITADIPIAGTYPGASVPGFAPTTGKQLSDTPEWMFSGRAQYEPIENLRLGLEGKYVGRRFATEDDAFRVPDYFTVNADLTYRLDKLGLTGSSIRFNVDNILDKHYFSSIGTQTCWTPLASGNSSSCMNYPYAYVGAPRTFQVTLVAAY